MAPGHIAEVLRMVSSYGVRSIALAEEIGISRGHLYDVSRDRSGLADWHHEPLKQALRRRALVLKSCGHSPAELRRAIEDSRINARIVAEKMGISRQALWQAIDGRGTDERRKDIQRELKKLGEKLMRLAR